MSLNEASWFVVHARSLAADGLSQPEIAEALGVSAQTVYNWKRRFGFVVARKATEKVQPDWVTERNARMESMFRQGLTLQVIGEKFEVTRERVRQILKARGLSPDDGGIRVQAASKTQAKRDASEARSLARWGFGIDAMKAYRSSGALAGYKTQKNNSRHRGVRWALTFKQWLTIWQESGKFQERGRGRGKYVMSRIKDEGGYVIGNVHIQLSTENNSEGIAKCRGNKAENIGVWCVYPGTSRPWIAKVGKTRIGSYATEEEAAAARRDYLLAHPETRVWRRLGYFTVHTKQGDRYQVVVGHKYVGYFYSPEEALAARAAYLQEVAGAVVHSSAICPPEPLNATQQI